MNNVLLFNILRFVALLLLQVGVLNQIQFGGYINPYLYILFVIMLPFGTPGWLTLVLAFIMGISIDLFCNTPGIHASATVFAAFIRPWLLAGLLPRDGVEPDVTPNIRVFGFAWFFNYSAIMVLIHHIFLFLIDVFKFNALHIVLWRTMLSVIFTMFLVVLSQFLTAKKTK